MDGLIENRIEVNKDMFTEEELKYTEETTSLIRKIYSLGLIDGIGIYKTYEINTR